MTRLFCSMPIPIVNVSCGIADRACQQEGYTHAIPFGQPVGTVAFLRVPYV
ncbi:YecR family lipoprotein [Escherichia coli]